MRKIMILITLFSLCGFFMNTGAITKVSECLPAVKSTDVPLLGVKSTDVPLLGVKSTDVPLLGVKNSTSVSREEAINIISKAQNITIQEAEEYLASKSLNSLYGSDAITYRHCDLNHDAGAGLQVIAWALVEIWHEGSFAEYIQVLQTGSELTGWSACNWESYVNAMITTPIQLDLYCRGFATITIDTSIGAEASFGPKLLLAGFSISASIGTTVTYTKMITFSGLWRLPF